MYKTILVAIDGSPESEKALSSACEIAAKFGAELHLVHASNYWQFMAGVGEGVAMISQQDFEQPKKQLLNDAETSAKEKLGAVVTSHFVNGETGPTIVKKALEIGADLIVLGSRGHSDIAGLLIGSVSHKVCNTAECSCLVVR